MSILFFLLSLLLSFSLSVILGILMKKWGIVDKPKVAARKIHKKPTPLGGGLALYFTVFLFLGVLFATGQIGAQIGMREILALFVGGTLLMIGGLWDDAKILSPIKQLIAPILAAATVVLLVTKPFELLLPFGSVYIVTILSGIIIFFWLMGTMYTTKLLDGLDGLVSGIVAIGALIIYFLTEQPQWFQPEVGLIAVVFAGACLGFLIRNWHPAKIFLGEGGSLFAGFLLGSLAIISGSKIATTFLVMGVPMLDVVRVIVRRRQMKRPVFSGDNEHLHFKLLHSGLSQKQTVFLFYIIALVCGSIALFLQTQQKFLVIIFLGMLMCLVGVLFSKKEDKKE